MVEEEMLSEYDILQHYGVKGMKWGVRRTSAQLARARGERMASDERDASEDARAVIDAQRKAKETGLISLSNKEIQAVNARLNMETQYKSLTATPGILDSGQGAVKQILSVGKTVNDAMSFIRSPAGQAIRKTVGG